MSSGEEWSMGDAKRAKDWWNVTESELNEPLFLPSAKLCMFSPFTMPDCIIIIPTSANSSGAKSTNRISHTLCRRSLPTVQDVTSPHLSLYVSLYVNIDPEKLISLFLSWIHFLLCHFNRSLSKIYIIIAVTLDFAVSQNYQLIKHFQVMHLSIKTIE